MDPCGFSPQQCVGEKCGKAQHSALSLLYSTTLLLAQRAPAVCKVSSWGTCGINLDLQPLPSWVPPPCFSCCFARRRPWLVISRNRALLLNTFSHSDFLTHQGVRGRRGKLTDILWDYGGRSSSSLPLSAAALWRWTGRAETAITNLHTRGQTVTIQRFLTLKLWF